MKLFTELILLQSILERLVQLLPVQLVYFEEKSLEFVLIEGSSFFDNEQEFKFGDRIEGKYLVLPRQVVDSVNLSKVLTSLFQQLFVQEI